MSETRCDITLTVNGATVTETVDARKTWSISCATISFSPAVMSAASTASAAPARCGSGVVVRGCLMLAAQCDGAAVETIEACRTRARSPTLQKRSNSGTLCNAVLYPGMLLTAQELLRGGGVPSREKSASRFPALLPLHRLSRHRRCHRGRRQARAGGKR
jgi:carbon-monoxide dehydrogenase small subunit